MSNLIINACEALIVGGEIILRTWDGADTASLSVGDNGQGIDETLLPKVFEPFVTSKGAGNSGLGLALAKQAVEAAGGTLDVRSARGRGAMFVITLPRADQPLPTCPEDPELAQVAYELSTKTVLIVDDDDLVRDAVGRLIRMGGGDVRSVPTPMEALAFLRERHCDLLITDPA